MFIFSGFLNIEGPVLSMFKKHFSLEYNPYIEAIIDPDEQDISKKLHSIISLLAPPVHFIKN